MTIQSDILAAMVHKSGPAPWMCNEIAQRLGWDVTNNSIGNYMQALQDGGLVEPIQLPVRGTAWQLTAHGLSLAIKPERKVKAAAKPQCGGMMDVARIMATEGVGHQDAYRLSIIRTDPAYRPGNRLPSYSSEQERVAQRREKARARVLNGIRQGGMTVNSAKDFAKVSWDMARFCLEGLVQEGVATATRAARGDVYRITDTARKCPENP